MCSDHIVNLFKLNFKSNFATDIAKWVLYDVGYNALKGAVTQPFEDDSLIRFVVNDVIEKGEMMEPEWKPVNYVCGAIVTTLAIPVDLSYGAVKGAVKGIFGSKTD